MQSEVDRRRAERRKKIRRQRMKRAFVFFLIVALITLAIMCFTVFFPIKRISVSGSEIYTKNQIIKASGLTTDDNLFVVSEDKLEDKIRRKLPYIDNITIKRVLPDAIIITAVDATEYAYYELNGKFYIISENNYLLSEQTEEPTNIFKIVTGGIEGSVGQTIKYANSAEQELVESVVKNLIDKNININYVDISNSLQITVGIQDKFTVVLGNSEYLQEKIAHLAGMVESIGDRQGKINLSMWTPQNSQGSFVENKS